MSEGNEPSGAAAPDASPAAGVDPEVGRIADALVRFVRSRGKDKTSFDDLRRRFPAWFAGRGALCHEGVVLCTRASPGFVAAMFAELGPDGRLMLTRGYLADNLWQRLPVTREREGRYRTSKWWPVTLTRRTAAARS